MTNEKSGSFVLKLIIYTAVVGFLVGLLELYLGHRFILNPLLYGRDLNFVYESYLAPTYYGLTKSIVVALVFFFVYLFTAKGNVSSKSIIIGLLGTIIFGIYYYLTFPRVNILDGVIIGVVHFVFIAGISYFFAKTFKLK